MKKDESSEVLELKKIHFPFYPIVDTLLMLFSVLPPRLSEEIVRIGKYRRDFPLGLSEIRARRGSSSIVISGENVPLFTRLTQAEIDSTYDRALGGALYAHTEELKHGFLSMPNGVRVGISSARRERGMLPTDISSLVFRLPSAPSECAGEIFELWRREKPRGTLIYSAPGGGKTSALRALAMLISRELALRVAVIDERWEFFALDYSECMVDLLSGYEKIEGIEIAMRTLSPEVIIIDEIGSEREAESLIKLGKGGVPVIATAHAESLTEATSRPAIKALCDSGYFDLFFELRNHRATVI